jgi:hypothetical protein
VSVGGGFGPAGPPGATGPQGPPGTGGGNTPRLRIPTSGVVTATAYAQLDIDCSFAPVVINLPGTWTVGTPVILYFAKGDPSVYGVTINAPGVHTLQHQNGPVTAAYPSGSTLQDAFTPSFLFQASDFMGTTVTYEQDENGNFSTH